MNKVTNTATVIKELQTQWNDACNAYLERLTKMWQWDSYYGGWAADEVGGWYIYGDDTSITMDNIRYCVEHNITHTEYMKWSEYCVSAAEFNFNQVGLRAWCEGCPRIEQETFDHLRNLKQQLADDVEKIKNDITYKPF